MKTSGVMKNIVMALGLVGSIYSGVVEAVPVLPEEKVSLSVFVSLSMFKGLLVEWQHEATQYGATLVLRGLVNDSLQQTVQALMIDKELETMLPVQIDPMAYERYGIQQVPAVVLAKGDKFDVVTGNGGIRAALEVISRQGELASEAKAWLETHARGI